MTASGLLAPLIEPDAVCFEGVPAQIAPQAKLHPEERLTVENATPLRAQQYRATRHLAHLAFERLGKAGAPLLNRDDRTPLWPAGLVGSVTHTATWCAVAVAPTETLLSIGIDAEDTARVTPAIIERVLTPAERDALASFPDDERHTLAAVLFSGKESLYKCQFPLSGQFLGFQDVELVLDPANHTFHCRYLRALPQLPPVEQLVGKYTVAQGLVVSAMVCRASQ